MARWKLCRLEFGSEELSLAEGEELSIGRSVDNKVSFSSLVISRNHCIIKADKGRLTVTDLQSSNGIYVGVKKIPTLVPYEIKDNDILGIGWTQGAPVINIKDEEKYMFRVRKIDSMPDRIKFEVDNELEGIKKEICNMNDEPASCRNVNIHEMPSPKNLVPIPTSNVQQQNKENINNLSNSIASNVVPSTSKSSITSPVLHLPETKHNRKRQLDEPRKAQIKKEEPEPRKRRILIQDEDVIDISDSDNDVVMLEDNIVEPNLESVPEEPHRLTRETHNKETPNKETLIKEEIKTEMDNVDLEYFNVKQEYLQYDDEAIQIDSDSDCETDQWYMRLSQSSPGKAFTKVKRESKVQPEESSYSQIDNFADDLNEDEEEADEDYENDIISIPSHPPSKDQDDDENEQNTTVKQNAAINEQNKTINKVIEQTDTDHESNNIFESDDEDEDFINDLICLKQPEEGLDLMSNKVLQKKIYLEIAKKNANFGGRDVIGGVGQTELPKEAAAIPSTSSSKTLVTSTKVPQQPKAQMIEPLMSPARKLYRQPAVETKHKSLSSSSRKKKHKHSSSKRHICNSKKEERKKKLKQIATKEKESEQTPKQSTSSPIKEKEKTATASVKVTSSNRGAFLSDTILAVKPTKRSPSKKKEKTDYISSKDNKDDKKIKDSALAVAKITESDTVKSSVKMKHIEISSKRSERNSKSSEDIQNAKKHSKSKSDKHKSKSKFKDENKRNTTDSESQKSSTEYRIPLKSLKPLSSSETEQFSGKPFSKVEPLPQAEPLPPKKVKKTVRFADEPPQVHVFFIEEGNKMKKTSLAKSTLVDAKQRPATFSLEKRTMIKILKWNPHWLDEQMNCNEPPPILGNSKATLAVFHFFQSHHQYVTMISDLLLMEIWESVTQNHLRTRGSPGLQMRIDHMPPPPSPDRFFELFNISVNVSVPNTETKRIPRVGNLLLVTFGPEDAKSLRFFYVHHVRCLPSPPKNVNSFFCLSLHTCYTDKMKTLKQGDLMVGVDLGYIQKEIQQFEAMDYLGGSPLLSAILSPMPWHFLKEAINPACLRSNYTETLNPAQLRAVAESVSAALGDRPCINMVQGPPGTGKSSVISAIIMSYFCDENRKRHKNRGKVLICATSNAAVDELVCRLLKIRQELEKNERFKLVRVGRTESMHKTALDMSSQELAKRDAARANCEPPQPGLFEEISQLEAKINMWKTQAQECKDPVRVAFCHQRVSSLVKRIALLRSSGGGGSAGGELRGEQLLAYERKIIEGADIILTTLSSAYSHKLRGLKRRIALCIVDEAGQAIEPDTLIPLTLDVTKLTLVGDPQQLPGYICSQRARKHGLGESLFSRISSCTELWPEGSTNPVILLNQQYRMHPEIADYPNRAFYNSRIQTMPTLRPNLPILPYLILSIPSGEKGQDACGGNESEAWGVSRLVASLSGVVKRAGREMAPPRQLSLAVITPYNGQKEFIKHYLRTLQEPGSPEVEVNTVDSFQGQERDVVVVSLARSQGVGFLTDAGRMNVMLTRAKHALIVCFNPHAMLKNLQWRTLVEDAQRRNLFRVLPNKFCTKPSPSDNRDEVLQYVAIQRQGN